MAVGLLVKSTAPAGVKAILNIGLTVAGAVLARALTEDGVQVDQEMLVTFLMTWVTNAAAYHNLLKPLGVTKTLQEAVPGLIGPAGTR
jgi:hypothetical protein